MCVSRCKMYMQSFICKIQSSFKDGKLPEVLMGNSLN